MTTTPQTATPATPPETRAPLTAPSRAGPRDASHGSAPVSLASIAPGWTDRAFLCGITGSGKTTLARMLLALRPYSVVIDTKGLLNWSEYERHISLSSLCASRAPRLLWRPSLAVCRDPNKREIDAFFWWVYERRRTTVYVDEVYGVSLGPTIPPGYHACLTRGRERDVETWSAAQRPTMIPTVVMSEAEHLYGYRLRMPQDRQKLSLATGYDLDALGTLHKHEFLYVPLTGEPRGPMKLSLPSPPSRG